MPGKGTACKSASDEEAVCKDVDHLVQEIKENLKLGQTDPLSAALNHQPYTSNPPSGKASSSSRKSRRHRPYAAPPCSRVAPPEQAALKRWNHRRRYPSTTCSKSDPELDDPFRVLQELISDGSLIKEAVRRLNLGLSPKLAKTFYYDSDEECRTPEFY